MEADTSYPRLAKLFHWLLAAIIAVWLLGFYTAHLNGAGSRVGSVLAWHKAIATTVVFVAALRLAYRLTHRYPGMPASVAPPMALAAKVAHVLLYAVAMIAAPLTGMYWSSVAGHPLPVLGLFNLPPIAPRNQGLYDVAMWAHRAMVWSAGALIAAHVLAALKHHVVDRDEILARMLPGRPRVGRANGGVTEADSPSVPA